MQQKKKEDRPVLRNNREQTVPLTDHIKEIWTSAQDTKIMIYNVLLNTPAVTSLTSSLRD